MFPGERLWPTRAELRQTIVTIVVNAERPGCSVQENCTIFHFIYLFIIIFVLFLFLLPARPPQPSRSWSAVPARGLKHLPCNAFSFFFRGGGWGLLQFVPQGKGGCRRAREVSARGWPQPLQIRVLSTVPEQTGDIPSSLQNHASLCSHVPLLLCSTLRQLRGGREGVFWVWVLDWI